MFVCTCNVMFQAIIVLLYVRSTNYKVEHVRNCQTLPRINMLSCNCMLCSIEGRMIQLSSIQGLFKVTANCKISITRHSEVISDPLRSRKKTESFERESLVTLIISDYPAVITQGNRTTTVYWWEGSEVCISRLWCTSLLRTYVEDITLKSLCKLYF